jgi:serine/threonine protein kinase
MAGSASGTAAESSENGATGGLRVQAEARLGQVVAGRWRLEQVLGVGGMACVYLAVHRNGRRAALKVLHPAVALHAAARRRFLSEGYAANKLEHPGAVLVLDDGEDGELVFLVMELLVGRTLAQRLEEDGPFSAPAVVRIADALLDVLAAAHERGVIHRDVKPSNVFELEDGSVKLLDFGVARVRDAETTTVTDSGVTLGTPAFMAPEQAAGRSDEVDALTDIWAVGATLFQLLTGRLVHEAPTTNAAIVAAATTHAVPVRELRPDVPLALARVVDRALAFEKDARYPNARAMQRALPAARGEDVQRAALESAQTVPEKQGHRVRSRKAPLIALVPVTVLLFALLAYALLTGARPGAHERALPIATVAGAALTADPPPHGPPSASIVVTARESAPSPSAPAVPKAAPASIARPVSPRPNIVHKTPAPPPPSTSGNAPDPDDRLPDTRQ